MSKNGNVRGSSFRSVVVFFILLTMIIASVSAFGCKEADIPSGEDRQGGEVSTSEPSASGADLSFESYGKIAECSTYAKGELLADTFYYKDAWFGEDPTTRNDALALMSMQLAAAAVTNAEDGAGASALRALGFERVGFVGFSTEDPDDCAYTWATKQLGGQTLVAIVFQSYALDSATKVKGWMQNFHVNDETASGEHAAFKKAAEKAVNGILSLGGENAKYWLMGQSRAGALANLSAAKLADKLGGAAEKIYAYTFEAPATVDGGIAASQKEKYAFIHNYAASDDIVPLIPMWGMSLYGNKYELKSEATELALAEELKKIGSGAAEVEFFADEARIRDLVDYLETRLSDGMPTRSDYSKVRRGSYRAEGGELVSVEYTYQEVMEHLMRTILSGELSGVDVDGLEEDLSIFASSVYSLAAALKGEASEDAVTVATRYYQAAKGVRTVINGLLSGGDLSLTELDLYALLRLAAPLMLDIDYEEEGDPKSDVSGYIYPTVELAQSFGNLTYAHHFDAVIARLKTLAPQPKVPSFSLEVPLPKVGDDSTAFPAAFKEAVKGLGCSWLSLKEAGWTVREPVLQADRVYYLEATVEVVGHLVSEEFEIGLGGIHPIDISCECAGGANLVTLRWEITMGTPSKVSVRFEAGHGAQNPATLSVDKGIMLKYVDMPSFIDSITDGGKTFLFAGWGDAAGERVESIAANADVTLYARWIEVVDEVRITFDIPSLGGTCALPAIPEGAPYLLSEYNVMDEEYHFIELEDVAKQAGAYQLTLFFVPIEGRSVFAQETISYDDYDEPVYTGIVTVNGEATENYFCEVFEGSTFISVWIDIRVE